MYILMSDMHLQTFKNNCYDSIMYYVFNNI